MNVNRPLALLILLGILTVLGLVPALRVLYPPPSSQSEAPQSEMQGGQHTRRQRRTVQDPRSDSVKDLRENIRSAAASKLAHARYATQRYIDKMFEGPMTWGMEFGAFELFPAFRSDRIYLVVYELHWPTDRSAEKNVVLCFQRTGRRLKQLYSFSYTYPSNAPVVDGKPKTLLDFLYFHEFLPTGPLSAYARRDLTTVREYVQYEISPYTSDLKSFVVSDLNLGEPWPNNSDMYGIDDDPFTGKKISLHEFYRRYGLPIPRHELDLMKQHGG